MGTRIENFNRKSSAIIEEKKTVTKLSEINSSDCNAIERILEYPLLDEDDGESIRSMSDALVSDMNVISERMEENEDERKDTLSDVDSMMEALKGNLDKLERIRATSDLVVGTTNREKTQSRIENLRRIRELLGGEDGLQYEKETNHETDVVLENIEESKYNLVEMKTKNIEHIFASTISNQSLTENETNYIRKIITEPHSEMARVITQIAKKSDGSKDDTGKNFTDHNEMHQKQVREKTTEALEAMIDTFNYGSIEHNMATGDIHFNNDINFKIAQAAAEVHDTGMSDHGYVFDYDKRGCFLYDKNGNINVLRQNPENFDFVRKHHSANSALNVLIARNEYKAVGFTDVQIDEIAILVYSHSKSNSGINDLNNSQSWKDCFDRIDAIKNKYNIDHPNSKISFNRSQFEGTENIYKLGSIATEALSLRIGDVSRDSGPNAIAQSGEIVYVDKDTVNSRAHSLEEEIENAVVMRANIPITDRKSKSVHIGEQNIIDNHTEFKKGVLTHTIIVNDGNYAPYCTSAAIEDHFAELCSAHNLEATMKIEFNNACTKNKNEYNEARSHMYSKKEQNESTAKIRIIFPWDEVK